jgi:hypothetical protein
MGGSLVPRDTLWRPHLERIDGVLARCTLIRLEGLYGNTGIMQPELVLKPGPDLTLSH